jgi:hypothetical protein
MKAAARKLREWILLGCGGVLALALIGGGEPIRGAVVAALGAVGAALVSYLGRLPRRWPRLRKALGRARFAALDDRLHPVLDAAEDALLALAVEGDGFGSSLADVRPAVLDLSRRALGLSRIRAGHEATLAGVVFDLRPDTPKPLELQARIEHARVGAELDQIQRALAAIGPSVRHLTLLVHTERLDEGQAPTELEERVAELCAALHEELRATHA